MKTILKNVFVIAAILVITVSGFAAESKTISVNLNGPTVINGNTLKPGAYRMVVTVNGSDVKAVFLNGDKKEVANAEGKFVEQQQFTQPVSVVVAAGENGTRTLREIAVKNMKGAIRFN